MRWQSSNIKRKQKTENLFGPDPWKWIALVISLIGVIAWTGGTAYYEGYWSVVGWSTPLVPKTLQETAYAGFTGAIKNWFFAGLIIVLTAMYCGLLEFLSTLPIPKLHRRPSATREPSRISRWLARRKQFDRSMGRFIAILMIFGIALSLLVSLPLIFWCYAAYSEGRSHIEKAICQARITKVFHTSVLLAEGKTMAGIILDRSDKVTVFLDRTSIHVVASGAKPVLLDTTNVEQIACPTK